MSTDHYLEKVVNNLEYLGYFLKVEHDCLVITEHNPFDVENLLAPYCMQAKATIQEYLKTEPFKIAFNKDLKRKLNKIDEYYDQITDYYNFLSNPEELKEPPPVPDDEQTYLVLCIKILEEIHNEDNCQVCFLGKEQDELFFKLKIFTGKDKNVSPPSHLQVNRQIIVKELKNDPNLQIAVLAGVQLYFANKNKKGRYHKKLQFFLGLKDEEYKKLIKKLENHGDLKDNGHGVVWNFKDKPTSQQIKNTIFSDKGAELLQLANSKAFTTTLLP